MTVTCCGLLLCRLTLVVLEQLGSEELSKSSIVPRGNSRAAQPREMHEPSGAAAGVLDVLNHLYISSSKALQQVDSLVLRLPTYMSGVRHSYAVAHKVFAAYQHLFQEKGFIGYHHSSTAGCSKGHNKNSSLMAADCDGCEGYLDLGLVKKGL